MSASLSLALLLAVAAAEPRPKNTPADVAKLPVEAAVGFAAGSLRQQVRVLHVLSRWERASAQLSALTEAEHDRAQRWYRGTLTAHEAAVATDFRGPVSVKELLRNYRWTGVKRLSGEIHLAATPHDAVERLFYSRFELRLDAATFLPNAMRFAHADDRPTIIIAIPIETAPDGKRAVAASIRPVKAESQTAIAAPRPLPIANKNSDKRVKAVLRRWQEAVSRDGVVETGFHMYQYDLTFEVEKRLVGTFRFDHPNRFAVRWRAASIEANAQSWRKNRNGRTFALRGGEPESWVCDGKKVIQEARGKTIDHDLLDPSDPTRLKAWLFFRKDVPILDAINELVPCACPTKADFETRYRWKIEKETAGEIWLSAIPKTKSAATIASSVKVILNQTNYRPAAVQCIDPGGNRETVYVYNKWITVPRAPK